jgi:hypothetical protein
MHDRAVRLTGAVKSAVAIAIEIMILLNIDLRIAQIRPRVEKRVQRFPALTRFRPFSATDVLGNRKAFEVATNMLVVISGEQRK